MKSYFLPLLLGLPSLLHAHAGSTSKTHPHPDLTLNAPEQFLAPEWFLAQAVQPPRPAAQDSSRPSQAVVFERFSPKVAVRWDEKFLYIEDNGMPAHSMMVGITNWQQQVPLPQKYSGENAWRLPLQPVPAAEPISIKGRFLRGAVALAANGIPIFNPQNNRGEVAAEIGELDQWGGHCGRADDYHYHAAPLHLQGTVGAGRPIAYALDGYPILGLTETDGAKPSGLDAFNGHSAPGPGYHYHASTKYPYINGGFHGQVTEKEGQVDPQPRAQPVREALTGLRGAKITGFDSNGSNLFKLTYEINAEKRAVLYAANADGSASFEFQNGKDGTSRQTYTPRQGGGGQGGGPPPNRAPDKNRPPSPDRPPKQEPAPGASPSSAPASAPSIRPPAAAAPRSATFLLSSPEVRDGGPLPAEYTGDGPGSTLPLEWTGAPAGTKSYTLVMHHLDPEGKTKWYWILYNIPPATQALPKNSKTIGTLGSSFRGQTGYEPPQSKGPGAKTYVLSLFALSAPLELGQVAAKVDYEAIMAAMQGKTLAAADLSVVYARPGEAGTAPPAPGQKPPKPGGTRGPQPPKPTP